MKRTKLSTSDYMNISVLFKHCSWLRISFFAFAILLVAVYSQSLTLVSLCIGKIISAMVEHPDNDGAFEAATRDQVF